WDSLEGKRIHLQVFDTEKLQPDTLLYDSQSAAGKNPEQTSWLTLQTPIDLAGRHWTLRFTQTGGQASPVDYSKVWLVFSGGTSICLLLFALLLSLFNIQSKARLLADLLAAEKSGAEELKKEKDKANKYLDIAGVILFALDSGGIITLLNKKGCDILGYEEGEILGRNWFDVCLPASVRDQVKDVFKMLMAGELAPVEYYENPVITKAGEERMIAFHNSVIRDDDFNIVGILCSGEDITARKKAELKLEIRNRINDGFLFHSDEKMYAEVLHIILQVMDSAFGTFGYFDEGGSFVAPAATRQIYWEKCNIPSKEIIFQKGTFAGIWGRAIKEKNILISNEGPFNTPPGHVPIKNTMVAPIIFRDEVISTIHIANKRGGYSEDDRVMLGMVADQIAPVLNARLHRDRQDRERNRAEEALRESEGRVRSKLDAILQPEGDMGKLDLADIIDTQAIQSMMDDFYHLTNIGVAFIDLKGQVLVATGWQDICKKFHRIHPETCKHCLESDTVLSKGVEPGAFKVYRCKNNMWDTVTPIIVGGNHLGNLFLGQFFFADELPNYDAFRAQARQYGFDEEEYMAALERVPRWSQEKVNTVLTFYSKFAVLISALSYSNIQQARLLTERDNLFNSLRESEEFARRVIDSSKDCIKVLDIEGNLLSMSVGGQKLLEIDDVTDYLNKSWVDFWKDDREAALEALSTAKKDGPGTFYGYCETSKGTPKWWEVVVTPINDSDGNISRLLAVSRDITEAKRAEDILKSQNKRLQNIIVDMKTGTWEWNIQTGETTFNDQWAAIAGYTIEELQPVNIETWRRLAHPDDLKISDDLFQKHFQGEAEYYSFDSRTRHKDGSWVWVLDRGKVIDFDENGYPLKMFGTRIDITERKRVEEALIESEQKFRSIFDNSFDAIMLTVPNGHILAANQSACRLFGRNEEEICLVGREGLVDPFDPNLAPTLDKRSQEGQVYAELTMLRKDGSKFTGEITSNVFHDREGKDRSIIIIRDITQRKQLETDLLSAKEAAQYASRAKSEFLANMSHEIRTPMNSVMGFADLLAKTQLDTKQLEFASAIKQASNNLMFILNDILDISKIEAGKLELESITFNLYDLCIIAGEKVSHFGR
ncbi:MAG: PAS domain S-box protein, partial [Deltaproteobacteria bacterium]|nr:PAS domain S-box protein [Deltaproteobacteria bacterium]